MSAAAALVPPEAMPSASDAPPGAPANHPDHAVTDPFPSPGVASPPATFDPCALVEPDRWPLIPSDVAELLTLLARADLYVQDEVDIRHHPTLTRLWSKRGHYGQRKIRAPGQNQKCVGFGAVDWRDGWCAWGLAPRRTADVFVAQLDFLVARSQRRGRIALVLVDNAKIHTPGGSKAVRQALERHGPKLRLIYTPPYDPDAAPIERLWPPFRRAVTHNHQRDNPADLYQDAIDFFSELDRHPERALQHIGSPFAIQDSDECLAA